MIAVIRVCGGLLSWISEAEPRGQCVPRQSLGTSKNSHKTITAMTRTRYRFGVSVYHSGLFLC